MRRRTLLAGLCVGAFGVESSALQRAIDDVGPLDLRIGFARPGGGYTIQTLPLEEVVVGDAVVLEMGDEIPADGRLVKATNLYVDQSLMTGESEPVRKLVRPAPKQWIVSDHEPPDLHPHHPLLSILWFGPCGAFFRPGRLIKKPARDGRHADLTARSAASRPLLAG